MSRTIKRDVHDKATMIACLYYFNMPEYKNRFGLFLDMPSMPFPIWWHVRCVDTAVPVKRQVPVYNSLDYIASLLEAPNISMFFCNTKPRAHEASRCQRCGKAEL